MKFKHLFSIVCLMLLAVNVHATKNTKNFNNYEESFEVIAESLNVEALEISMFADHILCNGYFPNGDRFVVWFDTLRGRYYKYTTKEGTTRVTLPNTNFDGGPAEAIAQCEEYENPQITGS